MELAYGNCDQLAGLVGKTVGFYGVDNLCFKLGRKVYEAVEDEDDGYRSYFGSVEVVDANGLIFFQRALATVRIEEWAEGDSEGIALVDVKDGHVWLRFGTDYSDGYYPYFFFTYEPRKNG